LPTHIRIGTLEHANGKVYNYFGLSAAGKDSLNTHDGAVFSSYATRGMEAHSAAGKSVSKSLKVIFLDPSLAGFQ